MPLLLPLKFFIKICKLATMESRTDGTMWKCVSETSVKSNHALCGAIHHENNLWTWNWHIIFTVAGIIMTSPFSLQGKTFCWLNSAFIKDWRVWLALRGLGVAPTLLHMLSEKSKLKSISKYWKYLLSSSCTSKFWI